MRKRDPALPLGSTFCLPLCGMPHHGISHYVSSLVVSRHRVHASWHGIDGGYLSLMACTSSMACTCRQVVCVVDVGCVFDGMRWWWAVHVIDCTVPWALCVIDGVDEGHLRCGGYRVTIEVLACCHLRGGGRVVVAIVRIVSSLPPSSLRI